MATENRVFEGNWLFAARSGAVAPKAKNVADAFALTKERSPYAVISGIAMPDRDGFQLAEPVIADGLAARVCMLAGRKFKH